MTSRQTENMAQTDQRNPVFSQLGRIIAVLELGARAHGEIRWLHLYYTMGLIPSAGLRGPLQKHSQSVLPRLERNGKAALYKQSLDSLARGLQEAAGFRDPNATFDSWATQVLKDRGDEDHCGLPGRSGPGDAAEYAQGYLDQRRMLQPKRPAAPSQEEAQEYFWQYHLGRTITWNGAGNDPHLSKGFQLGLKDKRTLCDLGKRR